MISCLPQLCFSFHYLSKSKKNWSALKAAFFGLFEVVQSSDSQSLGVGFLFTKGFLGIHGEGKEEVWIWRFAPTERRLDLNPKQKLVFFVTYFETF